jgi:hypothetical protein
MKKNINQLKIFKSFKKAKFLSYKLDTYFSVYEKLLTPFVGKKITFVEIGVLNGGSLFMWRDFLGKEARIIGIDFNPAAKKWEEYGFEIIIGDQSDTEFWRKFYNKVGTIDVLLDDGGHTNKQQIVTAVNSLNNIRANGLIIIEDTHTSYLNDFGNPSKNSFINFSKNIVDEIHSRSLEKLSDANNFSKKIYSVEFYDSITCFNIDENSCTKSHIIKNKDQANQSIDFRDKQENKIIIFIRDILNKNKFYKTKKLLKFFYYKIQNFSTRKYFKKTQTSGKNIFDINDATHL